MENNQSNNNVALEKRYNPLKDANFWVAFVLGGGPAIFLLIYKGFIFQSPVIINLVFLITWEAWIILKKGKKGSLVFGFFIAIIIAVVSFFPIREIENQRQKKQIEQAQENIKQQIQLELEKMKNSSSNQAKDARIIADMGQVRAAAMEYYSKNKMSYTGLCSVSNTFILQTDITNQGGSKWSCNVNSAGTAFCVYVQMNSSQWWCVDSTLRAKQYPSAPSGTCSASSFTCQ